MQKKVAITFSAIILLIGSAQAQTNQAVYLQADAVVTLPPGAGLSALATGDFNHDSRLDVAVCERSLGQVALYLRSATGTYPAAAFSYAVGQSPSGLVSFNRNYTTYHADLMALSGPGSQWTMLRDDNDPTGNLTRRVLTPGFGTSQPSANPQLIQFDYDQNGVADFAWTYPIYYGSFMRGGTYNNDTYAPFFIAATAPLFAPYLNTQQNASTSIAVADFDLNNRLDQVLTDSANNLVHVIAQLSAEAPPIQTNGTGPVHTAALDIDGDYLADLAIAYAGSNEVLLLRTAANFVFNRGYSYQLAASPRRVLLADLNRDNRPEMLVVTANNELLLYRHNGFNTALCYSTIAPQVLATGVNPAMLQTALLDADLYPDVLVGCAGDNTVRTYLTRLGQVTATQPTPAQLPVAVYPTPATDRLTIEQPQAALLSATLIDEVGRVVQQQELTQAKTTLPVGDLPRGLYVLRLSGAAGTKTTRLVLQ